MNGSRMLLLFVVGLVAGGALGAFVLGPRLRGDAPAVRDAGADAASADTRSPLAGRDDAASRSTGEPASTQAELHGAPAAFEGVDALQETNEALREERDALTEKVATLEERLAALEPEPLDPKAFRFGVPERAPSFDGADWESLAGHMENLAKELAELPEIVANGRQPDQAKIARIVKHNTPLATFAVGFGSDTSDATPNGAFTHPAVLANLIRASLMGTDMPLSAEQEIALKTLGDAWTADTARMEASFPANTPVLKRTVAEVDAKLRFLESARNVLDAQQRAVLFPPESTGRLKLDLLSPALVYVLTQPVRTENAADLESKLLETLLAHAGVEEPDVAAYAWIGRQWVDDIPGVTTPISETSMDLVFPHVNALQTKARAQVAAMERVLAMGNLTPAQADALRNMTTLMYPYVPAQ